jgi:hypothetical protein
MTNSVFAFKMDKYFKMVYLMMSEGLLLPVGQLLVARWLLFKFLLISIM